MGTIDRHIEILWIAYHEAVGETTSRMTAWTMGTIIVMLLLGLALITLRGRTSKIINTGLVVASIGLTTFMATTKYDAIRQDGYLQKHGRSNDARTVQIVCSVIKGEILNGRSANIDAAEREKLQKACGTMPTTPKGIDI